MDIRAFFGHESNIKRNHQTDTSGNETTCSQSVCNKPKRVRKAGHYKCDYCSKVFARSDALASHLNRKRPCDPSHPHYSSSSLCKYCNVVSWEGKSSIQIIKHKTYCKKKYNGITFHDRQRKQFEKFQEVEMIQIKQELRNVQEREREQARMNEELRESIKKLRENQGNSTTIVANIQIDKLYANMIQVVGDRFASLFDTTGKLSAYPWTDKAEHLILLAMDQRTKSCKAKSVEELALRIGANALHACNFSSEISESGDMIRAQQHGTNKIVQSNIDEFANKFNRTSQASIGEIEFLMDCEEDLPKDLHVSENKAIASFQGIETSEKYVEATKQLLTEVLQKGKRYPSQELTQKISESGTA